MINDRGTNKVHTIMSMHACSTTQKVLKCMQDLERPEVCLIDVSSLIGIGKTCEIGFPTEEFTLFKHG